MAGLQYLDWASGLCRLLAMPVASHDQPADRTRELLVNGNSHRRRCLTGAQNQGVTLEQLLG